MRGTQEKFATTNNDVMGGKTVKTILRITNILSIT